MSVERSSAIDTPLEGSVRIARWVFPGRIDYERYFTHKGYISSPNELWENPGLVIDTQRHWHAKGQTGCVFAQALVKKADEIGWETKVILGNFEQIAQSTVLEQIDSLIDQAVLSSDNEAVSLLFPGIISPEDFVFLIKELAKTRNIKAVKQIEAEGKTLIGLRTPIDNEGVQAWIVGFGPFNFLPVTRQAPSVEIAIRTKKKSGELFHMLNQDPQTAHLADMPTDMPHDVMKKIWETTVSKTHEILGGKYARSKNNAATAKITFAIPTELWESVGVGDNN